MYPGVCSPWQPVNIGGFGLPSNFDADGNLSSEALQNPFDGEENYGTIVFNGQLYMGMEADNTFGARLWRTRAGVDVPIGQANWEEVASDAQGNPFGLADTAAVDHTDSLAVFRDYLYVATANRTGNPVGINVFRSPSGDPGSWEDALVRVGNGFGDPANENRF